jgi:hypothetical protein
MLLVFCYWCCQVRGEGRVIDVTKGIGWSQHEQIWSRHAGFCCAPLRTSAPVDMSSSSPFCFRWFLRGVPASCRCFPGWSRRSCQIGWTHIITPPSMASVLPYYFALRFIVLQLSPPHNHPIPIFPRLQDYLRGYYAIQASGKTVILWR